MPNIVYVLTNPAMPGLVKIGLTNQADVRQRMKQLYDTATPLPFDCVIAWELAPQITAADAEHAFHSILAPHRVNPSREFFEIDDPEQQVVPSVRLLPGRDVTPAADETAADEADDQLAAVEFKQQRSRTDEAEFLESLTAHERLVNERILALAHQDGVQIRWSRRAFNLEIVANGTTLVICRGYPSTAKRKGLYPSLWALSEHANVPQEAIDALEKEAEQSGLFERTGQGNNLVCRTDRPWDDQQLQLLIRWLHTVIARARGYTAGDSVTRASE